ncbi:MAG: hypothetical protein RJA34_1089 [Pseudomonadota bacterium]|jgi:RimJ/RimL family protein N-acetyltransferase
MNTSKLIPPIRLLGSEHREHIAQHLLALPERDRYLRFGHMASDEQIRRYTDSLQFDLDSIFGIFNRKVELLGMAHLAFVPRWGQEPMAEFGVSVAASARGRGYGLRLIERAVTHARNEGVTQLQIHALSENTAMVRIAQSMGATVARQGTETEAHLQLLPATLDSRVSALIDEQVAQTDYHIKVHARQLRQVFGQFRTLRERLLKAARELAP